MQTKYGILEVTTRMTHYIPWDFEDGNIENPSNGEIGLRKLLQAEYNRSFSIDPGTFSVEINQDMVTATIGPAIKRKMAEILAAEYIYGSFDLEVLMVDLAAKGMILPGNYIIYV